MAIFLPAEMDESAHRLCSDSRPDDSENHPNVTTHRTNSFFENNGILPALCDVPDASTRRRACLCGIMCVDASNQAAFLANDCRCELVIVREDVLSRIVASTSGVEEDQVKIRTGQLVHL